MGRNKRTVVIRRQAEQYFWNFLQYRWWIHRLRQGEADRIIDKSEDRPWAVVKDGEPVGYPHTCGIIMWKLGYLGMDGRLLETPYSLVGMQTTMVHNKHGDDSGWNRLWEIDEQGPGAWAEAADYLEQNYEKFLPPADCKEFAKLLKSGEVVDEWPGPDDLHLQPSRNYQGRPNEEDPSFSISLNG